MYITNFSFICYSKVANIFCTKYLIRMFIYIFCFLVGTQEKLTRPYNIDIISLEDPYAFRPSKVREQTYMQLSVTVLPRLIINLAVVRVAGR